MIKMVCEVTRDLNTGVCIGVAMPMWSSLNWGLLLTLTFAFQLPLSLLKTAQNHPMVSMPTLGHLPSCAHTSVFCSA